MAVVAATAAASPHDTDTELQRLVADNRRIHDVEGLNLNPASNVMNPRAEALLAAGLGPRASLGHPGDKYEMGLQAIERIEVIAAELAAETPEGRTADEQYEQRQRAAAERLAQIRAQMEEKD